MLSIVGVDRVAGNAHYVGKASRSASSPAAPILGDDRAATKFHDFGAQVASWTRDGDTATSPPLPVQPIAVADWPPSWARIVSGAGPAR